MDTEELLLSTSESNKPFSATLWDYKTKNALTHYKNGCSIDRNLIGQLGNDYLIAGTKKEPKLYLWQVNGQDVVKKHRMILPEVPSCLAVCPHSCYLALGLKTELYIWQLASGKLLTVQGRNFQPITVVKFSNCGNFVILGGQDGLIITYRLSDLLCVDKNAFSMSQKTMGQAEPLYTKDHHNHPITDIHVGKFGRKSRFASCSIDQTVKLYELYSGNLLLNLVLQNPIYSVVLDSPCWNIFIGGSKGFLRTFKLTPPPRDVNYHLSEGQLFEGHSKNVTTLALNISETTLASGGEDGVILIWEISSRQVLKKIDQNSSITNLRFIPNHRNILSQDIKIQIPLQGLEMQMDLDSTNFGITVIQNVNIDDPQENCLEEQKALKTQLEDDKMILQAHNQMMFKYMSDLLEAKTKKRKNVDNE